MEFTPSNTMEYKDNASFHPEDIKCEPRQRSPDSVKEALTSDGEIMNCSLCKKDVPRKDIFGHTYQHMFAGRKMHPCHLCEKSFKEENMLRTHLTIHTGEKPHQCEQCEKSFRLPQSLKNHINIHHTKEDLATCDQCGETFTYRKGLVTHLSKVHGVETGYKCTNCNERFLTEKGLKSHEELNSCFKHCCTECGKVFKSRNNLNKHKETHMEKTFDFDCNQCGKAFPSIYSLKRHEKLHLDLYPFKCYCGKAFNRKDGLKAHAKTHQNSQDSMQNHEPKNDGMKEVGHVEHNSIKDPESSNEQSVGLRYPGTDYLQYWGMKFSQPGFVRSDGTQHFYPGGDRGDDSRSSLSNQM